VQTVNTDDADDEMTVKFSIILAAMLASNWSLHSYILYEMKFKTQFMTTIVKTMIQGSQGLKQASQNTPDIRGVPA
jgi:hypothetical protein